jgi:hypothetical protein
MRLLGVKRAAEIEPNDVLVFDLAWGNEPLNLVPSRVLSISSMGDREVWVTAEGVGGGKFSVDTMVCVFAEVRL